MANFGTFLAMASYSRSKASEEKANKDTRSSREKTIMASVSNVQYFATLQTFFSMALTLYVWYALHRCLGDNRVCTVHHC